MGIIGEVVPIAAPREAKLLRNCNNLHPIRFAVFVAVILHVPYDFTFFCVQRKIDSEAVIMIRMPALHLRNDLAFCRSSFSINSVLLLARAEAVSNEDFDARLARLSDQLILLGEYDRMKLSYRICGNDIVIMRRRIKGKN